MALAFACASVSSTWAGSSLHIGSGYNTPCQTGGCPLYSGEVNSYSSSLDIYQNSGGASALVDPVLLIFGVPNDTLAGNALNINSITSAAIIQNGISSAITYSFGTSAFGLNGNGFQGLMTSGEVYSFLGLTSTNASNSFVNWQSWSASILGQSTTNYGIYLFAFHTNDFSGQDYINMELSNIPIGTYAVAYGMNTRNRGNSTPFTESGMTHNAPEPMGLPVLIFGLALLGYATHLRKQ